VFVYVPIVHSYFCTWCGPFSSLYVMNVSFAIELEFMLIIINAFDSVCQL